MNNQLTKEYCFYLKDKDELTDEQRDDYLGYFKKQFGERLINMIEVINNS